jgi:hypothetical protein
MRQTIIGQAQGTMDFSGVTTLMTTFKTTTLKTVREAAEQRGYVVEGFAPTSRAARQLRDAGISADTLQGFLARARQPAPERHLYTMPNKTYVIDDTALTNRHNRQKRPSGRYLRAKSHQVAKGLIVWNQPDSFLVLSCQAESFRWRIRNY